MYGKCFYIFFFACVYVIPSTFGASKGIQIACTDNASTALTNECCTTVAGYELTCDTGVNITQYTCALPYNLNYYFKTTKNPEGTGPLFPEPGTVCIEVENKYQNICLITTSVGRRQICQGFRGTDANGDKFNISPRCFRTDCLFEMAGKF